VPANCSGIVQKLSEIDRYNCGWSTGMDRNEDSNEDRINHMSNEDEEQEEGQGNSRVEEEEESKMQEERDTCLDKEGREKKMAVVCR